MQDHVAYQRLAETRSSTLTAMIELIGLSAAFALSDEYAGRDFLYIPREPSDDLTAVIGSEPARRLCAVFGGDRMPIIGSQPVLGAASRRERLDAAILAGDRSSSQIAGELHCTSRWVRERARILGVKLPRQLSSGGMTSALETSPQREIAGALEEQRQLFGLARHAEIAERFGVTRDLVAAVSSKILRRDQAAGKPHVRSGPRTSKELLSVRDRPRIAEAVRRAVAETGRPCVREVATDLGVKVHQVRRVAQLLRELENETRRHLCLTS